jgi:hypothetical protein
LMSSIECLPVVIGYDIGATSRLRTRGSIRLRDDLPAKTDTHDCCPVREHRSTTWITYRDRLRRAGNSFKEQVSVRSTYPGAMPRQCGKWFANICTVTL